MALQCIVLPQPSHSYHLPLRNRFNPDTHTDTGTLLYIIFGSIVATLGISYSQNEYLVAHEIFILYAGVDLIKCSI